MKLGFLEKNTATCIKGIAAVCIMLSHLISSPDFVKLFIYGPLWVAVFFFYSGYGLECRVTSPGYLDGFIKKKVSKIYIPFFVAESAFTLSKFAFSGWQLSTIDVIEGCFGLKLYNETLWYVAEILMLYLLFFLINKSPFKNKPMSLWIVLYVCFVTISVYLDIGTHWYFSTAAFLLGIFVSRNERTLTVILQKSYVKAIAVADAIIVFALFSVNMLFDIEAINEYRNYITVALTMAMSVVLPLCAMTVFGYKSINNKILLYIGSISFEIYLWHMCMKLWFSQVGFSGLSLVLCVCIATIFISSAINLLKNYKRRKKSERRKC